MSVTGQAPTGLMGAFWAYEKALMANDVAALDRLFADAPTTLRGDAAGLLVGHEQISSFRGTRGGAPSRRIVETHVQAIDGDHALILAVTELDAGGRGQQTQLWVRDATAGWQVSAAHVSVPAPAVDVRIWRAVGEPLMAGSGVGALAGEGVAVKDLYAVAGFPIGAGNAAYLRGAEVEHRSAEAVARLLSAGADVRGIAQTDEFAYSLAGVNAHYGTPPNPMAPRRVPGGSSSGSASAVALGHVSIGLGTDTAGSIRIPSAYQGLYGIRTTHGVVSRDGLLPLAPSFDTVGWMTRSAALLRRVGEVLLPERAARHTMVIVTVPELMRLADPAVAAAVTAALPENRMVDAWDLSRLESWVQAFRTVQAFEAWQVHGRWLRDRMGTLGPGVRDRFEFAAGVTDASADNARRVLASVRREIVDFVADRVVALPAASSVAPMPSELEAARSATLQLTCLASIAGLPAVVVPTRTAAGLPTGTCLIAAAGRDRDLLHLAASWPSTSVTAA
jgi:Asp-tRNA(Asn)/Glu-tRNA(Gln) amidotransferase A subunit family amidase